MRYGRQSPVCRIHKAIRVGIPSRTGENEIVQGRFPHEDENTRARSQSAWSKSETPLHFSRGQADQISLDGEVTGHSLHELMTLEQLRRYCKRSERKWTPGELRL